MFLYSLSGAPFSVMRQPPSDLGHGPNWSGCVYRGGMLAATLMLIPYMAKVTRQVRLHAADAPNRTETDAMPRWWLCKVLAVSYWAAVATLVCAWTAVAFYDQNGDTFYLHDGAAALFVVAQPIVSLGYTAVMVATFMGSFMQVVGAALVAFSAGLVGAMLVPLLRTYNLFALCAGLIGLSHEKRVLQVERLAVVAWWCPISELALLIFTYVWYLFTAMATQPRASSKNVARKTNK